MWTRRLSKARNSSHTAFKALLSPGCAPFSTSRISRSYEDTIANLKVTPETTVVVQGFTGKQSTFDSKQSIEYGTKIIGGVRPGKEGEHLGLPYLPSIRAVKEQLNPHATLVYVAAPHAAGAIEEAIEAEIPLIVAVAEHIPLHDMLRVQSMLRLQSKSRLVGANSPGMTSTHARCRLGFQPIPFFKQGSVSIVAKSGTLSYETVASTTKAGLGQSYVIGMGGDALPGTDFVDALKIFEDDENTRGIILVGEVGGFAEENAAEWIKDYHRRTPEPKPIMALIGGLQAVPGRVMGHDGAFAAPGEGDARSKVQALEAAGVVMTDHPSKFGEAMKSLLNRTKSKMSNNFGGQRRMMHTLVRKRSRHMYRHDTGFQRRNLTLSPSQGLAFLQESGLPTAPSSSFPSDSFTITLSVDRHFSLPQIHIQRTRSAASLNPPSLLSVGMLYKIEASLEQVQKQLRPVINVFTRDQRRTEVLEALVTGLSDLWRRKEGEWFRVVAAGREDGALAITSADLKFDDWAFRMAGRHEVLHRLRDTSKEVKEEVAAEADGIVYIKLPGNGKVGTLVNGAGLAMNTTDALALAGTHAANFLDTGGKATSATVRASLRAVTSDPRVKAVFVNIFGGLTRCDMIAEGIVGAVREEGISVPLVVRLRGTCEAEGAEVLKELGGEDLSVCQDFGEAVEKVGDLVREKEAQEVRQ